MIDMCLHDGEFIIRKLARLQKNVVTDSEFADVMQQRALD